MLKIILTILLLVFLYNPIWASARESNHSSAEVYEVDTLYSYTLYNDSINSKNDRRVFYAKQN